ncbi:galanin-like peptide [Cebus imitator]|uniref:galanin-like peptide n=1 Tax=Cebus imitator TaxID=2715852 RepID=UPI00189B1453|nr:galanin-like peptide [Cebus imitator]
MAPSAPLALLLLLLSLAETPASAPAHQGRGGWTLNSAGYLLGPILHLPQMGDQDQEREAALEILDLWKAIDGLPYSRPQQASKRSLMETSAKPEIGDLGMLSENIPKEKGA